jgi:hypothetical protein
LRIVAGDLETGQHRNPTDNIFYFTDAYFHRPDDLKREVAEAGFEPLAVVPVEGLTMFAKNLDVQWQDEAARERLLGLIDQSELLPEIAGAMAHFICVGRKAAEHV